MGNQSQPFMEIRMAVRTHLQCKIWVTLVKEVVAFMILEARTLIHPDLRSSSSKIHTAIWDKDHHIHQWVQVMVRCRHNHQWVCMVDHLHLHDSVLPLPVINELDLLLIGNSPNN